jgi:hypothetical protein
MLSRGKKIEVADLQLQDRTIDEDEEQLFVIGDLSYKLQIEDRL